MSAKILLGCYEVPGWGGAATIAYTLFERMQRERPAVEYVNLVDPEREVWLRGAFGESIGNPNGLAGVHLAILEAAWHRPQPRLAELIHRIAPDLMVACGFLGASMLKQAAPHIPLVFLTSGCAQIKRLMRENAIEDFIGFERNVGRGLTFPLAAGDRERAVVEMSDFIILHTPHVRFAFEHFYPAHMGKVYDNIISIADFVYDEAQPFLHLARPFEQRDIDAIFIASDWDRHEKNYALLERIVRRMDGLRIHVVGRMERNGIPVQHHGIVARRADIYALLGRARTIVSPSRWDPAPGVLFEASAMGCNVIASRNCGNWQLCHEQLLAESADSFVSAIRRAVADRFPDNNHLFRGGCPDLMETIDLFGRA